MAFEISQFNGDATYSICCTGDVCCGDEIAFERATFSGSYRNAKFAGFERIAGRVIRDSYGRDKQQHTFTLALPDGTERLIKGRVIYREGVYRKPWADECERRAALSEKHSRGDAARAIRDERKAMTA